MDLTGYTSTSRAARMLGVSADCVRKWMRRGRLAHVVTDCGRLIPLAEVERIKSERARRAKAA